MKLPSSVLPLVEAVWKECREAEDRYAAKGETKYGNPPTELRIFEAAHGDWDKGWCKEPFTSSWNYDGTEFREVPIEEIPQRDEKPDGMYWKIGLIHFMIDPKRKRCVYHYTLGPRYARGYKTTFEDLDRFEMIPDRDRMLWLS